MIDWQKVRARFKKLKTEQKYKKAVGDKKATLWIPTHIPIEESTYNFIMSDRSRGKTTQLLLFLMIAGYDYNKTIEYVRTTDDEIAPKNTAKLFDVITAYDYIEQITHGEYNTVQYSAKYWYYAKSENGKIIETAEKPFLHCSAVRKYLELKSGYNSANSDLILYDEHIGKENIDDFQAYMQLQSTFFRLRSGCKAFFLSNTINKDASIFYEFTIAKPIENMQQGDSKLIKNTLGSCFYIEILYNDKSAVKQAVNSEYYGFENSKLSSITGAETWNFKQYQHIMKKEYEYISKNTYVYYHGRYYRLDIVHCDLGTIVLAHRATRTYDDSYIFTIEHITDKRYVYGLGYTRAHNKFWQMFRHNKFYFDTNETGDSLERYYNICRRSIY